MWLGPWFFGVRVRKLGRVYYLATRHGARAAGRSREEAMVNYARRQEARRETQ